jgi:arylsulfatase A-like enzyme/Tfp pilus assembly protein PilF
VGRLLRLGVVALILGVAGTLAWWWLRPPPPPPPRESLLLVSIDSLRADRLGYAGYAAARTPRLDGLAAGGIVFSQAATTVPLTLPAHASLMTGALPARHAVRDDGQPLGDGVVTLAEVLRAAGYRTGGFVGSFLLDSRWGLDRGFDRYGDALEPARAAEAPERRGDRVVAEALAWLDEDTQRPFFAWVHLNDPHRPYDAAEPYRSQFAAGPSGAYDAEVAWTDSLVGRLLDHLDRGGLGAHTWVVVVGDHGEALGEHGEEGHGFFLYEATLHVPLLVRAPQRVHAVVDEPVSVVDVMPTVLKGLLGHVPAGAQGRDVLPRAASAPPPPRAALSETWLPRLRFGWSELLAIRDGRYKYIQAPRPELYDLVEDPGETRDLAAADSARTSGFQKALAEAAGDAGRPPLEAASGLGRRQLEARPRDDPKDRIEVFGLLRAAEQAAAEGRLDDALGLAGRALAGDPGLVEAHTLIGRVHGEAGRPEASLEAYRRALTLEPEERAAAFGLALTVERLGRAGEAEAAFERARELDPLNPQPLGHLADLWMRKGRFAEAEAALKDALDKRADRPSFLLKLGECYIEMKRYAEAEAVLNEALAARPGLPRAHFHLARVHEARGDRARAIGEYEGELRRDAKDHEAAFDLARLLRQQGRLEEAAERLRAAVASAPDFAAGHLSLARVLLDLGDLKGAQAAARRGLACHPEPRLAASGHYVLAEVHTREGRRREAAREIAAARWLEGGRR